MHQDHLPFKSTGYFSSLICDYLDQKQELKAFYNRFPTLEHFEAQVKEKSLSNTTSATFRKTLVSVLEAQYATVETSALTRENIKALEATHTFTITTGHQLNLFTGPLYFLYKIVSAINLAKTLKATYPDFNFVPVYWMATEDHDFDEINYFNFKGKKIQWNRTASGAVGELSTEGLDKVLEVFARDLGPGHNAAFLKDTFEAAYLEHDTLADATRYLANTLFKVYGLVVIDANATELKRLFLPYMRKELFETTAFKAVDATSKALSQVSSQYKIQVNPRPINLFYITAGVRERIVEENGMFKVLHTTLTWTAATLEEELEKYPERFSPNVIMRPLYQEVVLPNLCYIGGGGELAYWMQLKSYFDTVGVTYPMLLLRNSALLHTEKQAKQLEKMEITPEDLFLKRDHFVNKKVRAISNIAIDFSEQQAHLKAQFKALYAVAEVTDASFLGAVKAQEVKQIQGLAYLEKRLLKAQKYKLKDQVARMTALQAELFPNESLQERNTNFAAFYLDHGPALIPALIAALNPLQQEFSILRL